MATSKIMEGFRQLTENTDFTIEFVDTNIDMSKEHKARLYEVLPGLYYLVVSATTKSTLAMNANSLKNVATISITGKTIMEGCNGVGSVYGGYKNYLLVQGSLTTLGAVRIINPSSVNYEGNLSFNVYLWFLAR